MPSSADLAALVEALLLRGLRPAGNVTRDGRPGSKSAIYRVEGRALSGYEAGVSVGSASWRFAARASGLAFGLALAVRPAGLAETPALKGGSRRSFLRSKAAKLRVGRVCRACGGWRRVEFVGAGAGAGEEAQARPFAELGEHVPGFDVQQDGEFAAAPVARGLAGDDGGDPVPLQNVVRRLTCRFSGSAHAARWYSLITPPRIFRRCTGASSGTTTGAS